MKNKLRTGIWVDDDSSPERRLVAGAEIVPVQTCRQAAELIEGGQIRPDFAVVDLFLSQGGWHGEVLYQIPGLHFIRYLSGLLGRDFPIAAYSISLSDEVRDLALKVGAKKARSKPSIAFEKLVGELAGELEKKADGPVESLGAADVGVSKPRLQAPRR